MNCRNLFLFCVLAFGFAGLGQAKDFYVSQNAIGSGSGVDVSDTLPLAWLNSAANWGSGVAQVSPGDTIHLAGTFTSTLVIQGSGVAGSPVTVLFEPGANFTSPCWPSTGAIQFNGVSWILIDGGTNGLIQNTANGTGLAYANNSTGIGGGGNGSALLNYCVIQNLTITNIYRNIPGDANRLGYPISIGQGSYVTVSNCCLSDGDALLSYNGTGNATNIFFLNNRLLNFNHGIYIGNVSPSYVTNLVIAGNLLDHSDVWGNSSAHHLDDIIIANVTTNQNAQFSGFYVYNNTFGPHFGSPNTAAIYNGLTIPFYQMKNFFIFNNLFLSDTNSWSNGFLDGMGSNVWVVNNTLYGIGTNGVYAGGGIFAGGQAHLYNNIMMSGAGINFRGYTRNGISDGSISSSQQGTNDLIVLNNFFANVWSDFNVIAGVASPNFAFNLQSSITASFLWNSGIFGTLNQWQTWCGNEWGNGSLGNSPLVPGLYQYCQLHCDPHSTTTIPILSAGAYGKYIPTADDTVAAGKGTNLMFLASQAPAIAFDFNGNPRSATGNWTIGAFNPGPDITLAASDLSPTNGESVTLSWTSANATSVTLSGFGTVALNGSTNVVANTNVTTYIATAVGSTGTNTTQVVLSPRPQPPTGLRVTVAQ